MLLNELDLSILVNRLGQKINLNFVLNNRLIIFRLDLGLMNKSYLSNKYDKF